MNRNIGAGLGERHGDRRAKPARRTGNQCDFALQIEIVEYQGNRPFLF